MPVDWIKRWPVSERSFNTGVGVSLCAWAVMGLLASEAGALGSPVRWAIALLNLLVGALFVFRRPVKVNGGLADVLQALPALVVAGLAFRLAPAPTDWPVTAQVLLIAGAALAGWSLLRLGRAFAVLPAWRGLVTAGPYRWVRHPAYLGELLMVLGCAVAAGAWPGYNVLVLAVLMVVLRARAEERVLAIDPAYQAYRQRVPDRLIPGGHALRTLALGRGSRYNANDSSSVGGDPVPPSTTADSASPTPQPGATP